MSENWKKGDVLQYEDGDIIEFIEHNSFNDEFKARVIKCDVFKKDVIDNHWCDKTNWKLMKAYNTKLYKLLNN